MQQALDGEQLVRPWIGVYYRRSTPALAEEQDLPVDYGALIGTADGERPGGLPRAARPRRPASRPATSSSPSTVSRSTPTPTCRRMILPHAPGDTITLRVLRDNSAREVEVTLGELPAADDEPILELEAAPHERRLDRVEGAVDRRLRLADADLDGVDHARVGRGQHGVGDRAGQRLDEVERAALDDLAHERRTAPP